MATNIGIIEGTIRLNDQFSANMMKSVSSMLSLAAVVGTTVKLFKDISREVMEDQKNHAQLVAVLDSTRKASEGVADALEAQALAMSRLSTFTDDQIVQADIVALKFEHIGGEIFPRVTQAAMDMAARTGGDVASAMESLGRALDDPIRGLSVLRRSGVTFTDEQKEQVKQLMASGELVKAQGILLDALATKYSGAAAAARNTMGGAITALKNSWDQLLETVGKDQTGPFRAFVETLVTGVNKINDNWNKLIMFFDLGVLSMVKSIHKWELALVDANLSVLKLAKSAAMLAGPAGAAFAAMFEKMAAAQRATRKILDETHTARERALGSDINARILAQVNAQLALGKAIDITSDGLVRETAAGKALGDALDKAASHVKNLEDALLLVAQGVEAVKALRLVDIADQLGVSLNDGAVAAMDALNEKAKKYKEELEAAARIASVTPGSSNFVPLEPAGPGARIPRADAMVVAQAMNEMERKLAEIRQKAADSMRAGLMTEEERRNRYLAEAKALLDSGAISQETYNRAVQAAADDFSEAARAQEEYAFAVREAVASFLDTAGMVVNTMMSDQTMTRAQGRAQVFSSLGGMSRGDVGSWMNFFTGLAAWGTTHKPMLVAGQATVDEFSRVNVEFAREFQRFGESLRNGLQSLVDLIGGTVKAMGEVSVGFDKEKEEWRVRVKSMLTGFVSTFTFKDEAEALNAAILGIINNTLFEGVSENIRAALDHARAEMHGSVEQLLSDLNLARLADTGGLSDAALEIRNSMDELFSRFEQYAARASELGMSLEGLNAWFANNIQSIRNSILGIEVDPAEALRQRAEAFNQSVILERAEAAARKAELLVKKAMLEADIQIMTGEARVGQARITNRRMLLESDLAITGAELEALGATVAALEAVNAAIVAMDLVIAQLNDTILITQEEIDEALRRLGRGTGGGGGRAQRATDQAGIRRELEGMGLGEVAAQLREASLAFDDMVKRIKEAGFSAAESARLIALARDEFHRQQAAVVKGVVDNFREFLGLVTPFDKIRKTAEDLIKDIQDSPFGDARKASMIGRIMAEVDRQVTKMAQEMAVGLFSDMLSDLEEFGASQELMAEIRKNMAIIEHTLKMEHYRTEIEMLRATGKLAPEVMAALDKAFAALQNLPIPGTAGGPPTGPYGGKTREEYLAELHARMRANEAEALKQWAEQVKRARDMMASYADDALPEFAQKLKKVADDFTFIKTVLGATTEVLNAEAAARQRVINEWLEPLRERARSFDFGEQSVKTGSEQFFEAQRQFRDVSARFLGGDLSLRDRFLELESLYRDLGDQFTSGEGFRFIDKEIRDAFAKATGTIPGFNAATLALGSAGNPMAMNSPALQGTIQEGNIVVVGVLREISSWSTKNNQELRDINQKLQYSNSMIGNV